MMGMNMNNRVIIFGLLMGFGFVMGLEGVVNMGILMMLDNGVVYNDRFF